MPDPDLYPSRIPDPKTATKERGEKKICCRTRTFFCSQKFYKIKKKIFNAEEKNMVQFSNN
jgi:hypothetical protein